MTKARTHCALVASVALAASVAGCGGGPAPSAPASASLPPSSSPTERPSTAPSQAGASFTLTVVPELSIGRTIPNSRVVFLVTVSGAAADGPVAITAQAPRAKVEVAPTDLAPGVVGEVTVIPEWCNCEADSTGVTITATRGGVQRQEVRMLEIVSGTDDWAADAAAHLAPFVTWLEANRPDLGITSSTTWEGTPGSWVLVVNHYLYFSAKWELDLEWHVMVPPDDWSRISLRKRWSEVAPSFAFEISSVAGKTEPKPIDPPDAVWR